MSSPFSNLSGKNERFCTKYFPKTELSRVWQKIVWIKPHFMSTAVQLCDKRLRIKLWHIELKKSNQVIWSQPRPQGLLEIQNGGTEISRRPWGRGWPSPSLHRDCHVLGSFRSRNKTYLHHDVHNDKESQHCKPGSPHCYRNHSEEQPQSNVYESQQQAKTSDIFVEYFPDKAAFGLDAIFIGRVRTAIKISQQKNQPVNQS